MVYWSIVASFDYCDFVISEFLAFSYYKMKMNYFLLTGMSHFFILIFEFFVEIDF